MGMMLIIIIYACWNFYYNNQIRKARQETEAMMDKQMKEMWGNT